MDHRNFIYSLFSISLEYNYTYKIQKKHHAYAMVFFDFSIDNK